MLNTKETYKMYCCVLFIFAIAFSTSRASEFCQTAEDFAAYNEPSIASPCKNGECDSVLVRDANKPDAQTRTKNIRMFFHILRNDDGTNPALPDPSYLDSQMVIINQTFAFPLDNSTSKFYFVAVKKNFGGEQ